MRKIYKNVYKLFLSLAILIPLFAFSDYSYNDFSIYQKTLTKEIIENKINKYLKKDGTIEDYYLLTDKSLKIYPSKEEKKKDIPEFTLHFGSKKYNPAPLPTLKDSSRPLKGWRIAIDPGHFGGEHAYLEERYIDMLPSEKIGYRKDIQFNEGELAYYTALILTDRLESLGAQVFLTKKSLDHQFLDKPFDRWLDEDFSAAVDQLISFYSTPLEQDTMLLYWKTKSTKNEIFRTTYNFIDLEKRAELINQFNPHLTVCIHYNLGGEYDKKTKKTLGCDENYSMVFVPGAFRKMNPFNDAFRKASMNHFRTRYEFVRFIVTNDIENSIQIGKLAINSFNKHLKTSVPNDSINYLHLLCIKDSDGIYHRNLTLTRLIHGPILYGEPLIQDNYEECIKLNKKELSINNVMVPKRIETVSNAYLEAIINWTKKL